MGKRDAKRKFQLSDQYYKEGRYNQALTVLDALNEEYPNNKNVMYPRAMCLARLDRGQEALALCDQLIALFSDPRAARLKEKLTGGGMAPAGGGISPADGGIAPEIMAIPDLNDTVIKAQPAEGDAAAAAGAAGAGAEQTGFNFFSPPVLIAAGGILLLVVLVVGALLLPEPEPGESGVEEAVTTGGAPLSSAGLWGRIALLVVIMWGQLAVAVYLTLLVTNKLPGNGVWKDMFAVSVVTIVGCLLGAVATVVSAFVCPCIAPFMFTAVFVGILRGTYELEWLDMIVLVLLVLAVGALAKFVIVKAVAPGLAEHLQWWAVRKGDEFREEMGDTKAMVPEARIIIDGNIGDWDGIDVAYSPTDEEYSSGGEYDVQRVRLAQDEANLYVLFEMGLGIDAEFDEALANGRLPSTRFGTLVLEALSTTVESQVTIGKKEAVDLAAGTTSTDPTVEVKVTRSDLETFGDVVAEFSGTANSESVGFADNYLELKVPLDALAIPTSEGMWVSFNTW